MVKIRGILATLVAFAVAVAPVAATLIASAGARAASAPAVHDCHGRIAQNAQKTGDERDGVAAANRGHDMGMQDDTGSCPHCPDHTKKCIGDGVKCCKLTGMVAVLPVVLAPAENVDLAATPRILTGWQARPPPPPPRA